MWKAAVAALAVAAAGAAAAAGFEGVIDSKITVSGPEEKLWATVRFSVARQGSRATTSRDTIKRTMLLLASKPGFTYLVDDEKRTYSEMGRPAARAGNGEPGKVTVTKLPGEKVAGYDCEHALVVDQSGGSAEVWLARALGGSEALWSALGAEGQGGGSRQKEIVKALRKAGLDGWPLKWKANPQRGESRTVVWEAVKVERKSLPASLFSLSGYTKLEPGVRRRPTAEPRQ